jgi:DNA-binding NtrC family response regulator
LPPAVPTAPDSEESPPSLRGAPRVVLTEADRDSERARILRALEICGGNQTRAAKVLNLSRRTLINRMEEFKLPRPKKG